MPDIFDLFARWWKRMLAVVILSVLTVGIITFLKPRKYLSMATAIAASSYASDKSNVFNENIQALYSALGSPDDLDKILGTAALDTVYLSVTRQFNLYDHYKIKEATEEAIAYKAAICLKKNTKVMKSEYGELKVKVWDTDKNLAPQLANAVMNQLQSIHQNLQSAGNEATLKGLLIAKEKLEIQGDSATISPERKDEFKSRILQYKKLIDEYQLIVDSKPPALYIVEKAKAAIKPDQPKRLQIVIATSFLSFLFSILAALVMERRKNQVS